MSDSIMATAPKQTLPDDSKTKNTGTLLVPCSKADVTEEIYGVLKISQNTPNLPTSFDAKRAIKSIKLDTGAKGTEVRSVPFEAFMEMESHREAFGEASSSLNIGVSTAIIPFELHHEMVKAMQAERTILRAQDLSTYGISLELPPELDNCFIGNAGGNGAEYTLEIRKKIIPSINDAAGVTLINELDEEVFNEFSDHSTGRRIVSGDTKTTMEKIALDVDQMTREIQLITYDTTVSPRVRSDDVIESIDWYIGSRLIEDTSFHDLQRACKAAVGSGLARFDRGDNEDNWEPSMGENSAHLAITPSASAPATYEIEIIQDGAVLKTI